QRRPPQAVPYTTLFRSVHAPERHRRLPRLGLQRGKRRLLVGTKDLTRPSLPADADTNVEAYQWSKPRIPWRESDAAPRSGVGTGDRKSTRLNCTHSQTS